MVTFFKSAISSFIEMLDSSSNKYTSNSFINIVFLLNFLEKISFLFPKDGWQIMNYQDFKLFYAKKLLNLFSLS